jgi:hypothetical protein
MRIMIFSMLITIVSFNALAQTDASKDQCGENNMLYSVIAPAKVASKDIPVICELLLEESVRGTLPKARECRELITGFLKTNTKDYSLIRERASSLRSCANRLRESYSVWSGTTKLSSSNIIKNVVQSEANYTDEFADMLSIVASFNEAVDRNDARIVTSMISALVTTDAKRLLPPAITTAALSEAYKNIFAKLNIRLESLQKDLAANSIYLRNTLGVHL